MLNLFKQRNYLKQLGYAICKIDAHQNSFKIQLRYIILILQIFFKKIRSSITNQLKEVDIITSSFLQKHGEANIL